jgi:hypothetical protein
MHGGGNSVFATRVVHPGNYRRLRYGIQRDTKKLTRLRSSGAFLSDKRSRQECHDDFAELLIALQVPMHLDDLVEQERLRDHRLELSGLEPFRNPGDAGPQAIVNRGAP